MAQELVIPTYQISFLQQRLLLGDSLSPEESALASSLPEQPLNAHLSHLREKNPRRFESIIRSAAIGPIFNYRSNYTTAQLLIKAYSAGLFNRCTETPELSNFKSHYIQYSFISSVRFIGFFAVIGGFNLILGIPRFATVSSLLLQNLAVGLGWHLATAPLVESSWRRLLPDLDVASRQKRSELLALQSAQQLSYQYPHVLEAFPPDAFEAANRDFLVGKGAFDHAHRNDFKGTNRKTSQFIYHKEHAYRLVNESA
jgi:hypothetical protein